MLIHTVEKGDTLYEIGKKHGVTVSQLISANGNTVLPTLIIGQSVIVPTPTQKLGSIITNGYCYPSVKQEVLEEFLPMLSLVTPFSYGVNENAGLVTINDGEIINIAENKEVRPLLIVTSLTEQGTFSSQRAAKVLSDEAFANTLINNIVIQLQKHDYYGVDIDFEYIPPEYQSAYPVFLQKLKERIMPLGFKLFVSLAPKTSAAQRGLLYEAHDYSKIGAVADFVLVMTYEWGYTYGPPMAVAPIDKVKTVLQYAKSEIDPSKILMGIPNYSYDWTLPFEKGTAAKSMSNADAVDLARKVGAEIQFDSVAMTPFYNYFDQSGKKHEVWFEDARSLYAKLMLLNKLSLAGFGVWNLSSFYRPLEKLTSLLYNVKRL